MLRVALAPCIPAAVVPLAHLLLNEQLNTVRQCLMWFAGKR